MNSITLKSPAKVNLFLSVINRRPDGYHNIETIFERISLFDEIKLMNKPGGKITVSCRHTDVPSNSSNLVYKAAAVLKKDFPKTAGVHIIIKKRIPVAAGLGGGSSNAAFVILGLNRLWQLKLGEKQLINYARKIGADVPFFIKKDSFALGRGKGDILKTLSGIKPLWHILVVPSLKVYTRDIYRGLNLRLTKPDVNVNMLTYALRNSDFALLEKSIFNALEYRVLRIHPIISEIKERLKSLGIKILSLSGSGPAVFGLVHSRKEGELLKSKLKSQKGWQVFVVRTF